MFKVKGTAIVELPEMEIEAESIEEAREKYEAMYADAELDGDEFEIDFYGEDSEDDELDDTEGEEFFEKGSE